ncbi:MAG: hypothetical protein P4L22_01005 [Candidatus Babeliales bacterium]|nr:hypothetical protein [Candidatus Babeliales bacterium]
MNIKFLIIFFILILIEPIYGGNCMSTKVKEVTPIDLVNVYKDSISARERTFYKLALDIEKILIKYNFYSNTNMIKEDEDTQNVFFSIYIKPIVKLPDYKELFHDSSGARKILEERLKTKKLSMIGNIFLLIANIEKEFKKQPLKLIKEEKEEFSEIRF